MTPILSFLFFLCTSFILSSGLQCKDPNNQPVDWYVIYKLPKQTHNIDQFIKNGLGFVYMTSKNHTGWTFAEVDINDTNSMVAHTLNGSDRKRNLMYILYNDQPPYGSASESKGHTKGVVMADSKAGFWLIHSVPHFPYGLDQYSYPQTGTHYGQSFLCISLNLENVNKVGLQLQYNEPRIYAQNVPEDLAQSLPEILKAANNKTIKNAPWYNMEDITSQGGDKFLSFAKTRKFQKDLYADLVSSALESSLYVETWPNERNRLPSECDKKFQVDNIQSISIPRPAITFKTTVDHSKWAVSAPTDSTKWICIGDVNRAQRQTLRGGGTTCINNEKLADHYQQIVQSVEACENSYYYYNVINSQ